MTLALYELQAQLPDLHHVDYIIIICTVESSMYRETVRQAGDKVSAEDSQIL